jgi:carbamoyltransferase
MKILGITHPLSLNPAACMLVDGVLIAFAEEERFIRLKHAPHFHPAKAVAFCLEQAGLLPSEIDITGIGFEQPNLQHARHARADDYVVGVVSEEDWFPFSTSLCLIHGDLQLKSYGRRWYADHHLSHAASAAIPSGFPRTNFITLDAWGGRSSGMLGVFDRSGDLEPLLHIEVSRSWGMTYELVTEYLGFQCHSAEGKTMGLAYYGQADASLLPDFCEPELGLPDVKAYEAYMAQHFTVRRRVEDLIDRHRDLAATVQHYYERSLLLIANWL